MFFENSLYKKIRMWFLNNELMDLAYNNGVIFTYSEEKLNNKIDKLVKKGADVNYQNREGKTPLMAAVICDNKHNLFFVKKLLDKGANLYLKDFYGNTAVVYAREKNKKDILNLLLNNV